MRLPPGHRGSQTDPAHVARPRGLAKPNDGSSMVNRFVSTSVALALALSASVALAGTYVTGPLPAEFGGGFIPQNPGILKNIQKASKEGSKFSAAVEKCYSKGAA